MVHLILATSGFFLKLSLVGNLSFGPQEYSSFTQLAASLFLHLYSMWRNINTAWRGQLKGTQE
jgi:hypothetical protein